jgi:hypothetical protein
MSRFFATLVPRLMVLSCLAMLVVAVPAQADTASFSVDVSGNSMWYHGTAGGSFTIDSTWGGYMSNWSITVSEPSGLVEAAVPGATNPFVFSPANGTASWGGPYYNLASFDSIVWLGAPGASSEIHYTFWLTMPVGTDLFSVGSCTASVDYIVTYYNMDGYQHWTPAYNFHDYSFDWGSGGTGTLTSEPVPLPSTLLLLGSGLLGLMARWGRRRMPERLTTANP